jgi:hypothetical protein
MVLQVWDEREAISMGSPSALATEQEMAAARLMREMLEVFSERADQ